MLTPEYLAGLPDAILKLWEEAELTILRDMARRISTYDYWIPAADYQNERLLASGRTQEEIFSVLAGVTKKSEAELRKMMVEAGSRCLRNDVAVYTAAGLTPPAIADSKELTAILNEGYKATAQTMKNLTRTTARTATRQFENALDTAWTQISSGAFDAESAIRQAVKGLSEKGIEAIRYPESGRVDTIETAVRRAVLTGVNQTASRLQEELADELGCDLVEVSAHAGARPEHAEWQGKIYSRSGTSEKYPDFRSSTGYGTGAGLCGWNCRHTFGPYIEGSPRIWTDEKLAELNAPKYEYQGEKFTEYEARQKEKYLERQIQRWNREAAAMKAAGLDDSEARAKVRAWKDRSRDFALNRKELGIAKPQSSGIIKSLDIDDFYLMAEGHEINEEVLKVIADVISEYESADKVYFAETEFGEFFDTKTGKPALLQTDVNAYGLLKLNVNSSILAGRSLEEVDALIATTKSNQPLNMREAVIHECGHARAYYGKTARQIEEMNKQLSTRGVPGISYIAEKDGAECIAEVEVLLYRGDPVPEDARLLYDEIIGGKT